ncbi:MAG: IPT/TIG domain-containing protein [Flavobacteriaceae bacterium]|nr:IPT/TIG domain-containing protein [Flavobacteriaceae bacterium]
MKKINFFHTSISLLICLFLLVQCSQNDILERSYPTIETLDVTQVSENGVTFNATITNTGNYAILEHGFVWSTSIYPTIHDSEKIIFNSSIQSNKFSADISTTLNNGYIYTVRSFIKTKDYLVYGNALKFQSFGSKAAIISKLEPNTGVWGDTIKIIGDKFSFVKNNNKVVFGDKTAKVISSTDKIITCIVPEGITKEKVDIILEIANREALSPEKFTTKKPIITSISPLTATFGEEVTITGDNFGVKPEYNKVFFGNIEAEIIYTDKNKISILVPNKIESKTSEIKIKAFDSFITYKDVFALSKPFITSTNLNVYTNTEVEINGKNFHPIKEKNKIWYQGIETQIVSASTNSIKVIIPNGPYLNRTAKIKGSVLEMQFDYNNQINILDKWLKIKNDLPLYDLTYRKLRTNPVVIDNKAYIFARDSLDGRYKLFVFDSITKKWSKIEFPQDISDYHSYAFILQVIGKSIYIYKSEAVNYENFIEFNTETKIWTTKSKYFEINNEPKILGHTYFTLNNEIYIGLGKYRNTNVYNKYLEKYNPINNSWTTVSSNLDLDIAYSTTFVINNIAYVIGGSEKSNGKASWSYNSASNSWVRISDFPYSIKNATSYVLNNKGYVIVNEDINNVFVNEIWEYNPQTNSWKRFEDFFSDNQKRRYMFSFAIGNKAYAGGGSIKLYFDQPSFDFFEYKPD